MIEDRCTIRKRVTRGMISQAIAGKMKRNQQKVRQKKRRPEIPKNGFLRTVALKKGTTGNSDWGNKKNTPRDGGPQRSTSGFWNAQVEGHERNESDQERGGMGNEWMSREGG